jgi:hypothetical protein
MTILIPKTVQAPPGRNALVSPLLMVYTQEQRMNSASLPRRGMVRIPGDFRNRKA